MKSFSSRKPTLLSVHCLFASSCSWDDLRSGHWSSRMTFVDLFFHQRSAPAKYLGRAIFDCPDSGFFTESETHSFMNTIVLANYWSISKKLNCNLLLPILYFSWMLKCNFMALCTLWTFFIALAAWSSGIVTTCHRGDWSYGLWDRIPPAFWKAFKEFF
jgi:hypothetical protein